MTVAFQNDFYTPVEEIDGIVSRLRKTFESGKTLPIEYRKQQLLNLDRCIVDNEAAFLEALNADLKCRSEAALDAKVSRHELHYALNNLDDWVKPQVQSNTLAFILDKSTIECVPLGVATIIAPWNYPLTLILQPLIGAIAAGCTTIMKPSEVSYNTAKLLSDVIPKYLDPEAFAVVNGGIPETKKLLEQNVDHIFYTGNGFVGRQIMEAASKNLTPVTLELGGKSPVFIDRSANLKVTAQRVMWGKTLNAGQTCIAPDYILVHPDMKEPLVQEMKRQLKSLYGPDLQASKDYSQIINERHMDRLQNLVMRSTNFMDNKGTKGTGQGRVIYGGLQDRSRRFFGPTIIDNVDVNSPVMKEEVIVLECYRQGRDIDHYCFQKIFGPLLPIITVNSVDEAIQFINSRDRPLTLYIFSGDSSVTKHITSQTCSGSVCINDVIVQFLSPYLPFGGVGESGMGRYHGKASFDNFSHQRSHFERTTLDEPLHEYLRYPPHTSFQLKLMFQIMFGSWDFIPGFSFVSYGVKQILKGFGGFKRLACFLIFLAYLSYNNNLTLSSLLPKSLAAK